MQGRGEVVEASDEGGKDEGKAGKEEEGGQGEDVQLGRWSCGWLAVGHGW